MRHDFEDRFRLEGRVALVTGGGRGIGAATATALAAAGADVALVARTRDQLTAVSDQVRSCGRRAHAIVADITADLDMSDVVESVVQELGALDVVVNNAGGANPGPFTNVTRTELEEAFRFNVSVPFELVKAAVPHLLRSDGAAVVNVSSNLGRLAARGFLVYGTAKAALSHLTRLLAADLAPGIRVNAVAPGVVATTGLREAVSVELQRRIMQATPLRRLADPMDVASAVVWLASPASSYLTGEVIELEGGADAPTFPMDIPDLERLSG
jgi:7-alpha-hydroxysteroid dehydrogenase